MHRLNTFGVSVGKSKFCLDGEGKTSKKLHMYITVKMCSFTIDMRWNFCITMRVGFIGQQEERLLFKKYWKKPALDVASFSWILLRPPLLRPNLLHSQNVHLFYLSLTLSSLCVAGRGLLMLADDRGGGGVKPKSTKGYLLPWVSFDAYNDHWIVFFKYLG